MWLISTDRPTIPVASTSVSGLVSCPPVRTHPLSWVNLTAAGPRRRCPITDNHGSEQQIPNHVGPRFSTVDQSISPLLSAGGSYTPFLEGILAFLLELQKTSGNSASLPTSFADQPRLATARPRSIPTELDLTQGVLIASSYPNCLLQLLTGNVAQSSLRGSPVKCVPSVQRPVSPVTPLEVHTFNIKDRQSCETPGTLVISFVPGAYCSPQSSHVNRESQYRPRSYSDLHQVLNADSPPPVPATTLEAGPVPDHPTEPYAPDAPLAYAEQSSVSTELEEILVAHSSNGLRGIASYRHRVTEWLREADLFVAENSYDLPLDASFAVAIAPEHYGISA
ncbi:hypothetical protein PHET_03108 [Paragonimus heterotremus]|uniref:Uncharacterized protein n=1 Tax=Paragonimus heterotremus TaxID=100268 RepID=A0A8J4WJB2_9TREM|nr:hypothetical protein PHET_03108 [Paragonimus heterotremus]